MRAGLFGFTLMLAAASSGCQRQDSAPAGANASAAKGAGACALSVGWDPWEPYQYQAADGAVRGLDIEITGVLAGDVGCTLEFRQGSWLDLLRELRDGRVDVLLAATVIPEREQYAWFSDPYRQESFALYVRAEELSQLARLDLKGMLAAGKRIGFTDGYYYGADLNALATDERYEGRFIGAPVVELNYSRLMDGSVDALVDDPFVAASVIRRKGWTGKIARHAHVIPSGRVSLMFSRAKVPESLVHRFNDALARRQRDGSLDRILEKYGS